MKKFSRLAFFDFDGTLTDGSEFVYEELCKAGAIDYVRAKQNFQDCRDGKMTYEDLVARDVAGFQVAGMTKQKMLDAMSRIRIMIGARETLEALRNKGFGLFIISGGINVLVEKVFPDYKTLFEDIFINDYQFDIAGHLVKGIATPYDFHHKATCIKATATRYDVPLSQTIFTGDNFNDVEAAQTAGISFAFNTTHEGLIKAATHHIQKKDLREILKYL
ncbi:MAG: HAD-IB family phosphatase [bacterium]|nr:HAD-IB family phosphatase [bacterium]